MMHTLYLILIHMLHVCTEDMPCWNCHTMGNRICG